MTLMVSMAMVLAQVVLPQEILMELPHEKHSPLTEMLSNFQDEFFKVPTRQEFFYYLEGGISAAAPFALLYGEEYQNQYAQLISDFSTYRQSPSLTLAEKVNEDIKQLFSLDASVEADFNQAMGFSLASLYDDLNRDLNEISENDWRKILGQQTTLFTLSELLPRIEKRKFDKFDDRFDDFISDPTTEKHLRVLKSLLKLQEFLKDHV